MKSTGKEEAIEELSAHLAREEAVSGEEVLRVLSERERLGSTGIGDGVAIPHGTMSGLSRLVALFGRSVKGIQFDAIDGKPSHLFVVLMTPDNNVGLQALARVSRMMRREEFRQELLKADGRDGVYRLIQAEDERL